MQLLSTRPERPGTCSDTLRSSPTFTDFPELSVVASVLHRRRLSGLHDYWRGTWLGNRLWAGLREFSLRFRPFGQSMRLTSLLVSQISAKYGVAAGNIWRNVGILWAMFVGYTLLVILGSSLLIKDNGSTSGKIFDRPLFRNESASAPVVDEKKSAPELEVSEDVKDFSQAPVFTYQSVNYTVQVDGKDKKLLDCVSGLVQPGKIRALMGASGSSASFSYVFSLRRSLADLLLFPVPTRCWEDDLAGMHLAEEDYRQAGGGVPHRRPISRLCLFSSNRFRHAGRRARAHVDCTGVSPGPSLLLANRRSIKVDC